MEQPTRRGIFAMAAKQLRQDFEELSSVPHAALRGGEAEELVRRFLRDHMPRRFEVGSGFIIDPRDAVSRQTDVIVYDALNCPTYRASDTAGIYPSNNVAAVIEVKSKLDGKELTDALEKIASVKSLSKVRSRETGTPVADQTHGSVLAFGSSLTLDTIAKRYVERFRKHGFGHHADVICVLDKGIVTTAVNVPAFPGWCVAVLEGMGGEEAEGAHVGVTAQELGPAALDAYFRLLLAQLTLFRNMVDHPGFGWGDQLPGGKAKVTYLTSFTNEKDPVKRDQKLAEYSAQAQAEMSRHPVPPNWPGRAGVANKRIKLTARRCTLRREAEKPQLIRWTLETTKRGGNVRFVPATQVGGPLVSGMVEQWEWYRDGGSYAKHRDFLTVHWEAQESSPHVVRLHVDAPRYADDPQLNGLKADLVQRLLSPDVAAAVQARGFVYERGRLVSDKSVTGNKSTEPFKVVLTPVQEQSSIEANLVFVHDAFGALVQGRIDPVLSAINRAFGLAT